MEHFFKNPCPPGTNILRKMEGDPAYEIFRMTELFSDDTIISLWKQLRTSTRSLSQACETIINSNDFPAYHNFIVINLIILLSSS